MDPKKTLSALLIPAALLTACATDDPYRRTKTGAGVGAVVGAVLGHQMDDKHGKVVGAVVGAAAGAAIGNYMDKQQAEFERQLAEEQRRHAIELERVKEDTLKLNLDSEISFDFDSAEIKPGFRTTLDKIADILRQYPDTTVRVVGHTDSRGSSEYNQRLSERRAAAVARYLESRGVSPDRISYEGRGEREPRASNDTEAGRRLNRRVEIYIQSSR